MIDAGASAPEFTLPGTSGDGLKLSDLRGARRALLIFYPRDKTTG